MITVAVEGDTDVPFAARLCEASGFRLRMPIITSGGKGALAPIIQGFASAGHGSPHLVIRDMDRDAPCPSELVATLLGSEAGPFFSLRIAVRAVEAWFLADRAYAAETLRVRPTDIPLVPDEELDPKLTIVNLARRSTRPAVRLAIVPKPGISRKAAAGYEAWLIAAAAGWSFEHALAASPSLARAHARLLALSRDWASRST